MNNMLYSTEIIKQFNKVKDTTTLKNRNMSSIHEVLNPKRKICRIVPPLFLAGAAGLW